MAPPPPAEPAAAEKAENSHNNEYKVPVFPVGPAGKRDLRKALVRSTDPAGTIEDFQRKHSLHSMMARAFETTPSHEIRKRKTRSSSSADHRCEEEALETLDTDSVMTFLTHLGVTQYDVHKRISDTLMKQLEDEIRKSKSTDSLLDLLQSCWAYATTMAEIRPVLWTVLKHLGEKTPPQVLSALAERDDSTGQLKHAAIFQPLPSLLKRLCWEADWEERVPRDHTASADSSGPQEYLKVIQSTLLFETVNPLIQQYCTNNVLVESANRPFVATVRERRIPTKQRRALTSTTLASGSGGTSTTTTTSTSSVLRTGAPQSSAAAHEVLSSGKAVAQLRTLLCDSVGSSSTFRPKLLYALLSTLITQHGVLTTRTANRGGHGGAEHLHCTLVADILLSVGGPLPMAYQHVLTLARVLDDAVAEGNITDVMISRIQSALKLIFQPDSDDAASSQADGTPLKSSESSSKDKKISGSSTKLLLSSSLPDAGGGGSVATKRQLNRIILAALTAMKEADPQNLFLNPVTDEIAPGYSRVISKPMSIVTMEMKVKAGQYNSISEFEKDAKLMLKNCIEYNQGAAGQWFRGEAQRQGKVFREEIYPNAKRLYHNEVAKQAVKEDLSEVKRKNPEPGTGITPLMPSNKKRKKEREDFIPSIPALASMLLADPFVLRILSARVLRELQREVAKGSSIPASHKVIPSLLQISHLAHWSPQICAVRGKRYFVPACGMEIVKETDDPTICVPFISLRRAMPLLVRLFLEADLERRIGVGGDLHTTGQIVDYRPAPLGDEYWVDSAQMEVTVSLVEGGLIDLCQPGRGNELALAVMFPKFGTALKHLSNALLDDQPFFICLSDTLLKHRSKIPKATRDAVFQSWLDWLKPPEGDSNEAVIFSKAHEYLIRLLNEWSSLGNLLLPRDTLLQFAIDIVKTVDFRQERTFARLWKEDIPSLERIRKQYERMMKSLPAEKVDEWRSKVGLDQVAVSDAQ